MKNATQNRLLVESAGGIKSTFLQAYRAYAHVIVMLIEKTLHLSADQVRKISELKLNNMLALKLVQIKSSTETDFFTSAIKLFIKHFNHPATKPS